MAANTDNQENHWPGYVDALTTMTMVLTFVLMVLGISIFTLSQNVSRAMIEKIAKAADVPAAAVPGGEDLAERIVAKIESMQQGPAPGAAAVAATVAIETRAYPASEAERQTRIVSAAEAPRETSSPEERFEAGSGQLRIVYKPRSTQIDDEARDRLTTRLGAIPHLADSPRIEVLAGIDPDSLAVSDSRRVAFYRAIRLRGELMKQGVQPDRIHLRIDRTTPGDDVVVKVRPPTPG
jgi:hypothetical protein